MMKIITKKIKTPFPNFLNFSIFFLSFENASGLNAIKKPIIPEITMAKQIINIKIIIKLLIIDVNKYTLKIFIYFSIFNMV